ncbi:ribonuclease 3-like [Schistocerca gregaria]|uniref:ribonuclease 3-like n=1 Tax=Schistocerca gregaria TaxID=7010 RepID=UPI00211DACCC|nr:ribonuclease 3-like [Schistocerca gregaria]
MLLSEAYRRSVSLRRTQHGTRHTTAPRSFAQRASKQQKFAFANRPLETETPKKSERGANARPASPTKRGPKKQTANHPIREIAPSDRLPSLMERKKFTARLPKNFVADIRNWEVDNSNHLKAVEQHFTEQGLKFNNWHLAQQALTHFNYPSVRGKHNALISRLGEKALRMFLTEFIALSDPTHAKKEWFVIANLNCMMRNDFVTDSVAEKLKLVPIIRYQKSSFRQTSRKTSFTFFVYSRAVFALIGSIYLDQGMESAKAFVSKYFLEPFRVDDRFRAPIRYPQHVPHCTD